MGIGTGRCPRFAMNGVAIKRKVQMKLVNGYDICNGDIVSVAGHPMVVSNKTIIEDQGQNVLRFTGTCTFHGANDNIRQSSFNGGRYGQLAELTYLKLNE